MQWKTRFNLRKLIWHKYIQLPGLFESLHYEYKYSKDLLDKKVVFTTDEIKALRPAAIVTWDNYKQYGHIPEQMPTRCLNHLKPKESHICFQMLSPSKLRYYVLFNFIEQIENPRGFFFKTLHEDCSHFRLNCNFNLSNPSKMTWRKMSQICKNMAGSLPHFTFKEELDDLLALLKLSVHVPPIHAMFIGLNFHQNQVIFC